LITLKWRASWRFALLLAVTSSVSPVLAAELDPDLNAQMRSQSARFRLPVLLFMREFLPVPVQTGLESGRMLAQLRAFAEQSQASLVGLVTGYGSPYAKPLVLVNALSASLTVPQIESLLMREDVLRIEADPLITASSVRAPAPCRSGVSAPKRQRLLPCEPKDAVAPLNRGLQFEPTAPAADQVADAQVQAHWRTGHYGQDAVLAIVDTGVDLSNPEIARNFRGHPGDWLDVHREHVMPTDRHGHGTRISSLIFGKHGSGENIGLAPRARWIAAKVFNDEHRGRLSDVYQAWAWLLDPDGNPSTADAPDIVLNAWGLPGLQATCNSRHAQSLAWLRQARIHMVFPLSPQEAGPAAARWPARLCSGWAGRCARESACECRLPPARNTRRTLASQGFESGRRVCRTAHQLR
jgi:Subtilase family